MEGSNDISDLKQLLQVSFDKISVLATENVSLREEIVKLQAENADLRRRLGMNSDNSHKPPSSDGYKKKRVQPALPKPKGKAVGGQSGHKGETLTMVSHPDSIVVHVPQECPCCLRKFSSDDAVEVLAVRRQVFDLPVPRLVVTEHRLGVVDCCGHTHQGVFPADVVAPVQYGVRVMTLASMLNINYHLPYQKVCQLLEDVYDSSFNVSTLFTANQKLYETCAEVENTIKEHLLVEEVVHADETGMRIAGSLHWFHTLCSDNFSYLFVHAKRGLEALKDAASLFPQLTNWVVHDCWSSYFDFTSCKHALCNAHILRELQALIEHNSVWAKLMHEHLMVIYQESNYGRGVIKDFEPFRLRYEEICRQADAEEPPAEKGKRGKPKNSKGRNLLNRLIDHQSGVLAFAQTEAVPFTNNTAERDIRIVKTKQKVATCFRTFEGAEVYARIMSVIKTIRKRKLPVFKTLVDIYSGQSVVLGGG